jgi:hypothetical protein
MLAIFDAGLFDQPSALLLGALTGLVFGFLLQKGGLTRADTIIGQFVLRDFTVLKVMGTAILVGAVGIYGLLQIGWLDKLHVKGAYLVANALGGLIFGTGMAILGYCPGTAVAAIGDGSRDAIAGVLGMVFGAAVFAEAFDWIKANVLPLVDLGKETLVTATGLSPWWFIGGLAVAAVLGFSILERWEVGRRPAAPAAGGAAPTAAA